MSEPAGRPRQESIPKTPERRPRVATQESTISILSFVGELKAKRAESRETEHEHEHGFRAELHLRSSWRQELEYIRRGTARIVQLKGDLENLRIKKLSIGTKVSLPLFPGMCQNY